MKETINNRYQLLRVIGEGGYGKVWLAYDKQVEDVVAIKVYKDDVFEVVHEEAEHEFQIGRELRHPNILPVLDFIRDGGTTCLVMPYCPHSSIRFMRGKLKEKAIWKIAKDVASGMRYLHECGIVHLDINLSNILLDAEGNYVLCDLGISRNKENLSIPGGCNGKTIVQSEYLAPERNQMGGRVGPHSDIWSFGIALYELAYGKLPRVSVSRGVEFWVEERANEDIVRLQELISACTRSFYSIRPSADDILTFIGEVEPEDTTADITTIGPIFPMHFSSPGVGTDDDVTVCIIPEDSGNVAVRAARERFKVVKDEKSSQYGIVDADGNVQIDFVYDKIGEIQECYWPTFGPYIPSRKFIGARFWKDDETGYLKVFEDGSIREVYRYTNAEYEEQSIWT